MLVRTEYSFRQAFGTVEAVLARLPAGGIIADDGAWGHVPWSLAARKAGKKSGLGVRLRVAKETEGRSDWRDVIFVATSNAGLREVYGLVATANKQFHWFPRLSPAQAYRLAEPGSGVRLVAAPGRHGTPPDLVPGVARPFVPGLGMGRGAAFSDNRYPAPEDREAWSFALGPRAYTTTAPAHIMSPEELEAEGASPEAMLRSEELLEAAAGVELPKALNIKFPVVDPMQELRAICTAEFAGRRLDQRGPEYAERLDRELRLVAEKGFADYFLVIADMIRWAKERMLVGPGRGSSAGSLVCWLLRITEVDPLRHGLLFERFIDVNRFDTPDIDIDFPDDGRGSVLEYLAEKYGQANVAHIGTVMRYKPKSALTDVAKELKVPEWDLAAFKDVIIERSSGDSRVTSCLADSFAEYDAGKALLKKYPAMIVACALEGGARQSGKHAAGMIVCNDAVENFCAVGRDGVAQLDKKSAEKLNMLKIDALGLRTLSVLQTACEVAGIPYMELYSIPIDYAPAFDVLSNRRYAGIFQFEGQAVQSLANQMSFSRFEDMAAMTALARPGPLSGGGALDYIERHEGRAEAVPIHPMLADVTKDTFGTIIYQEQVMTTTRVVGGFSWADTAAIRKLMSNRQGDEAFRKFEDQFITGAVKNGVSEEEARKLWKAIDSMGCLAGDTALINPHPSQSTPRKFTIAHLAKNSGYIRKRKPRGDGVIKRQNLLAWHSQSNTIKPARCEDAFYSGMKETFKLEVASGEKIRATGTHRFLTPEGYKPLSNLRIGDLVAVQGKTAPTDRKRMKGNGRGAQNYWPLERAGAPMLKRQIIALNERYKLCQHCRRRPYQETHHKNGDHTDHRTANLLPVCRKCHRAFHGTSKPNSKGKQIRWAAVRSIMPHGPEPVYDVTMPGALQNFVANGFVVHNSWSFNLSHAVVYGLVSYWCCYMKAKYPLAFAAGCLRHAKDTAGAMGQLRELLREGFEYTALDPLLSDENWSVKDGRLLGGLMGVPGIGAKTAREIIVRRKNGIEFTLNHQKLLARGSVFANAFPCRALFGEWYKDPWKHNIRIAPLMEAADTIPGQVVCIIGRLTKKNLRDMNEDKYLIKRGGVRFETQTKALVIHLEDDSGKVIGYIDRKKFEKIGAPIADKAVAGETWLAIRGRVNDSGLMGVDAVRWVGHEIGANK